MRCYIWITGSSDACHATERLMEANNPLMDIIRLRIREEGPISFHDFMEMCLYYPELGYYTNTADKIGAGGDFYTSCCLTPAFGAMVARQLEEIWRVLGKVDFTIVEYGAGTGMLCRDILAYLKEIPELYEGLRYCIIEISPTMRNIEQTNLPEKVSWHNGIEDIDGGVHCVLSNELLDNFPIHQVVMKETPMEVFVDFDGCFREILVPASARIESYFNEMGIELAPGFRTEVNLDAQNWINNIADRLRSGFIVTIDYGGCSEELLQERRRCGTLLCYRAHQRSDDPYIHTGQQDITSHVNFSALMQWGERSGLHSCGLTTQGMFLLALGFKEYLRKVYERQQRDILTMAREEAFVSHTLLFDMGQKYKVLVQSKNVEPTVTLKGLSVQPEEGAVAF